MERDTLRILMFPPLAENREIEYFMELIDYIKNNIKNYDFETLTKIKEKIEELKKALIWANLF